MMKRALLAAAALLSSTIISTPTYADTVTPPTADAASQATLDAMQAQCDALAALHGPATGDNDHWTGEVVEGAVTSVSGPTEVGSTRVIDEESIVGTGTFTPGSTYIQGEPFRIGGSVNMFGDQYADSGHWSDSTYNFTADFNSTFAHAFSCNIYQEVFHPGDPLAGYYEIRDDLIGSPQANAVLQECNAYNTNGSDIPHPGYWGNNPQGNCQFVGTPTQGTWDDPLFIANEPGTAVNQDQTDTLDGIEDHGGPVDAPGGVYHIGQTVICISPSTPAKKGVPGAWVSKNGYIGSNCTTDWFKNHAVWGSGTESSNGTYISVPDYNL